MKKSLSLLLALLLTLGTVSIAFADTFGLGIVTSIKSSASAYIEDDEPYDGKAQVDSTICAVILDDNGVIVDIKFDVAQTAIPFTPEGEITADMDAAVKSKMEKGEEYGMRKASPIGKELFEQVEALQAYCIGKAAEEIINMPTYQVNEEHTRVSDVADLKTTCTIDVGAYLDALAKAVANAK